MLFQSFNVTCGCATLFRLFVLLSKISWWLVICADRVGTN